MFKKGERIAGRQKGTPNKVSSDVKAMVLEALSKAGGTRYLLEQAKTNPNAFVGLVGKVLPLQLTGQDDKPLIPQGAVFQFVVQQAPDSDNKT